MPVNTFRLYVLVLPFRLELTFDFSQLVFGHIFRSPDVRSKSNFLISLWALFLLMFDS